LEKQSEIIFFFGRMIALDLYRTCRASEIQHWTKGAQRGQQHPAPAYSEE